MATQITDLPKGTELVKKSNKNLLVGLIIGLIFCLIITIIAVNNPMYELIGVSMFFLGAAFLMLIVDSVFN
jgi:hypothetical protein